MAEVQNQLKPLIDTIDRHGKTLRSLYANGSGGPPGYLEMARAEDKEVQTRLFTKIDKLVDRMEKVEEFMRDHQLIEEARKDDEKRKERRLKQYIAYWSLGAALFMVAIAIYDHRDAIIHSLLIAPPTTHSQLNPQDAAIPAIRR